MDKHNNLLRNKFPHVKDDLLYNSGGNIMWSLFRAQSCAVTIYYHERDDFFIIQESEAIKYTLLEIAENWNSACETLDLSRNH